MKDKSWRKHAAWFFLGILLILFYKTVDGLSSAVSWINGLIDLLMPFFIGALIAYLLYIPSKKVEDLFRKIKIKFISKRARGLSVLFVYLAMIFLFVIVFNILIPRIYDSVMELSKSLPTYYANAKDFLNSLPEDHLLSQVDLIGAIENLEQSDIVEKVVKFLDLDNVSKYIKGIVDAVNVVFNIFVSFIVSVYLLLERSDIKSFARNLLNAICTKKTCKKIARYYRKTNVIFYQFISGQIIDAFVIGVITSVAMTIMDVKYSVLLGFFIGLFNVIPYFGAIVAVGVSAIITIFTGGIQKALWMAIVIIVLQQVDANVINPRILGNSLKISPILVIFAVTFFGAYFGVLGMFLGVPIIALFKVIILDYIEERTTEKKALKDEKESVQDAK